MSLTANPAFRATYLRMHQLMSKMENLLRRIVWCQEEDRLVPRDPYEAVVLW